VIEKFQRSGLRIKGQQIHGKGQQVHNDILTCKATMEHDGCHQISLQISLLPYRPSNAIPMQWLKERHGIGQEPAATVVACASVWHHWGGG
jgi:hypothetical protein